MNINNFTLSLKIIGFSIVTFLCFSISLQSVNKRRSLVGVGSWTVTNLFTQISNETKNLFYLVDKNGMPVSLTTLNKAVGSKSIQIPPPSGLTSEQKNMLNNTNVTIEENMQGWVNYYLSIVKKTRSKSLKKNSLQAFNQYWNSISPRYQNGLVQILHSFSMNPELAKILGFQNKKGTITLLFFDDPYPAHTVPGSSKKPFKDLLLEFITRYGF